MIENLLNDGYYIHILSKKDYQKRIDGLKKEIKGKSKYENYCIVDYLPKNKEFYVVRNYCNGDETGYEEWEFEIVTIYKGLPLLIIDEGSN